MIGASEFSGRVDVLTCDGVRSNQPLDVEGVSEAGASQVIGVVRADGTRQDEGASGYGAVHLFSVRDGKIVRFREYTDLNAALD